MNRAIATTGSLTIRLKQLVELEVEGAIWEENSTSGKIEKGLSDPAVNIYLHDRRSSPSLVTPSKSLVERDFLSE